MPALHAGSETGRRYSRRTVVVGIARSQGVRVALEEMIKGGFVEIVDVSYGIAEVNEMEVLERIKVLYLVNDARKMNGPMATWTNAG